MKKTLLTRGSACLGLGILALGLPSTPMSVLGADLANHGLVAVGRFPADQFDRLGDKVDTLGGFFSGMSLDTASVRYEGSLVTGTLHGLTDRGWSVGGGAVTYDYHPRVQTFSFSINPYTGTGPVAQDRISLVNTASLVFSVNGSPLTGYDSAQLPAPAIPTSPKDSPGRGQPSIDSEGLAKDPQGGWFVADEYGPVIHRFNAAGELIGTFLPPEAYLPKRGNYPATLNWTGASSGTTGRRNNRGFEGLTVTPDGKRLVTVLQSPLVQDGGRAANSRNSRVLFFDIEAGSPSYGKAVAEYVYPLTLQGDATGNRQTILSEVLSLNQNTFLVSERDALGYGSGDTNACSYKRIVLFNTAEASNLINTGYDFERGAPGMKALPTNSLPASIKPVSRVDLVDLLNPADLARFGLNNTASDSNSMPEKWEGLGLIPKNDPSAPDDYYLLIGTDNDLTASLVYHNGIVVATNDFTVDTFLFAYHVTIPGVGAAAPPNALPTLAFTGPSQPTLSAPARVDLDVEAYDQDGVIVAVEFYEGATKLGEDTSFPFSLRIEGVAAGSHGYRAVCRDNVGATAEASTTVSVTVDNLAPTVRLTSPVDAAYVSAGSTVALSVNATDPDGYVAAVEYLVDGAAIGTSTKAPFSLSWSNAPAGSHTLLAVVKDNQGVTRQSDPVVVNVLPAKVVSPLGTVAGLKFPEWSVKWWQWALRQDFDAHHPLKDEEGDDAHRGQSGSVWFLGGVVNDSGKVTRKIVVPAGKYLYFPLVNGECSNVENPPFAGGDVEGTLRGCAMKFPKKDVFCTIDGVPVAGLAGNRILSPMFTFEAPAVNFLGVPGPTNGLAVDEGYYAMLEPLSPGQHTLQFGGTFAYTDADPTKSFSFRQDVTYEITVPPTGVLPPYVEVAGKTQAEWSGAWWQWALSQGTNTSPLLDRTGANANVRQYGDVFFVSGLLGYSLDPLSTTRTFTVPAGKHLFFPVLNGAADNIDVVPPVSEQQLREWAAGGFDSYRDVFATIDGNPVTQLTSYRQRSPLSAVVLPPDNVFQPLSPGYRDGVTIEDQVSDGIWVMLSPLSPGDHVISFGGKNTFGWSLAVTNRIRVLGPTVVPATETYLGKTYGEWGAAWWQWAWSLPFAQNPIMDTNGAAGHLHQSGDVWFLAGTSGASVTRELVIPYGKSLFFPTINIANDYPCPDPNFKPAEGQSLEDFLLQGAKDFMAGTTNLFAEVDGVALTNLFAYRGTSAMFNFTADISLRDTWDSCVTGTEQQGVSDGYWVMLQPLSAGNHVIHLGGGHKTFGVDVTYHLTVLPPGVLPPYATVAGVTQADYSSQWWTWASEQTSATNPLLDTTGVQANNLQKGSVFFLGGTFGSTDDPTVPAATRHYRVPAGKHLFFPLLNGENDNATYDPDVSLEQLQADLKGVMDNPSKLVASIDGIGVPNPVALRQVSGSVSFTLPPGNIYKPLDPRYTDGLSIGPAAADGYWVMLEPLSAGAHVIDYGGRVQSGFSTAVRAFVTVVPEGVPFVSRIGLEGGSVKLEFWAATSGSHQVESASEVSGPWTAVGAVVAGDGEQHEVTIPAGAGNRFFRVQRK